MGTKNFTKKEKLEAAKNLCVLIEQGHSFTSACYHYDINRSTVEYWMKHDGEIRRLIKVAENHLSHMSRLNVARSIEKGSVRASQWWLERRNKDEFSLRVENEHKGEIPVKLSDEQIKEFDKFINKNFTDGKTKSSKSD